MAPQNGIGRMRDVPRILLASPINSLNARSVAPPLPKSGAIAATILSLRVKLSAISYLARDRISRSASFIHGFVVTSRPGCVVKSGPSRARYPPMVNRYEVDGGRG